MIPAEEDSEQLYLPPPKVSVRPPYVVAADHVPVLKDFVKWHVARENRKRDLELQEFCEKVARAINKLQRQQETMEIPKARAVDSEHLWGEDFFRIFSAAGSLYRLEPDEEKRKFLRAFVVNYSVCSRPDITLTQVFWNIIRDLSGTHVVILQMLYVAQKSLAEIDRANLRSDRPEALSIKALQSKIGLDDALTNILLQDLAVRGLLRKKVATIQTKDRSDRIVLEEAGFQFMRFLQGNW